MCRNGVIDYPSHKCGNEPDDVISVGLQQEQQERVTTCLSLREHGRCGWLRTVLFERHRGGGCALQKPDRQPRSPERWKCIRSVFCSLQKILVCLMTFGGGSPMSSSLRLSADMIIAIKCRNLARKQQQLALVSKYLLSKN